MSIVSFFQALAPIGALLSGPIAGWIADLAGRKAALMLVGIPYLVGYLMMVYARFIPSALIFKVVLFTGRFFTGVGLGWSCLATPVSFLFRHTSKKKCGSLRIQACKVICPHIIMLDTLEFSRVQSSCCKFSHK